MNRDQPDGPALLAECRRLMAAPPTPEADARLQSLMIASALGMAEREWLAEREPGAAGLDALLAAPAQVMGAADDRALAAMMRAGNADASPALHEALLTAATARFAIAKGPRRA